MEQLLPDLIYHIYNHANGSDNIFREEKNYSFFLQKYEKYISPITETYAYCLMPNHFHWLVKIKDEQSLLKEQNLRSFNKATNLQGFKNIESFVAKQFSNFFNSYSKAINKTYHRQGSLFNPRFKRKLVASTKQFQATFLYIHLNPVKHGFVNHEEDWKWSSLHNYTTRIESNLLNMNESVSRFESYENLFFCLKEKRERIFSMEEE